MNLMISCSGRQKLGRRDPNMSGCQSLRELQMKESARQTCLEVEEFKATHEPSLPLPQIPPDAGACMKSGCRCCRFWARVLGDTIGLAGKIPRRLLLLLLPKLQADHVPAARRSRACRHSSHPSQRTTTVIPDVLTEPRDLAVARAES